MKTYKNMKYNGLWNKIKNFYFCKSRCICRESEEKRKLAEDILDKNIKFYKQLPKTDFDCNNFNCNLYSYDSYIYENETNLKILLKYRISLIKYKIFFR